MPSKFRLALFLVSFSVSVPGFAQTLDAQSVLDRLIQSYGGENSLRQLDSMTQEWDMVALMRKTHGTDVRSIRAPNQLRVDLSYPQKSETRILNGNNGFVLFEGVPPRQVNGMQKDAMQLQLMRLYSPLMLRQKISSIGLQQDGDLLALTLAENGVHVHYMVNKENWRIEQVAGVLLMQGQEIQFLTEYSDFKVIEGVLVHHKENKFANGMNTAVLQLRKITFDVEFDETLFNP
jgi:hypothetical protein